MMPDVRLIDANALRKDIHTSYSDDLGILEHIDNAPTVDAQPVKHGRWIEVRRHMDADGCIVTDYKCSECGFMLRDTNPDDRDSEFYCYHCGADMRGGAKNGNAV